METKIKSLIASINRSLLRHGFFLLSLTLVLVCFSFSPNASGATFAPTEEERVAATEQGFNGELQLSGLPRRIDPQGRTYVEVDDMLFWVRESAGIESAFTGNPWTNGTVYYVFDATVSSTDQQNWRDAAATWSAVAPLTFIEGTGTGNYIYVQNGSGNNSYVGMIGGPQVMNIFNWTYRYIIAHEIGHALGLIHEHQRSDRDSYVTINYSYIQSGYESNFYIAASTNYGTYDFDSVMHYDKCSFSTDCPPGSTCACTHYTITVPPPNTQWQDLIGQRDHLSQLDGAGMAQRYASGPPETITVANGNDMGPGSLRQAILDASSGDTINFAAGVTTVNLLSGELLVNKNLTIAGPGANVLTVQRSSAPNFRIFHIAPNTVTVTISGLTISNGAATGAGISSDGELTLTDSVISYNSGAAIASSYVLTMTNCTISTNNGDAIASSGLLTATNCTISNNSGRGVSSGGRATIAQCTIASNQRVGVSNNGAPMTITQCTIANNQGVFGGGGIFNTGSMTITDSTVSGNSVHGDLNNPGVGGGICNEVGILTVTNSTISGNSQTDPWGGGGGLFSQPGTININSTTISGNLANGSLGGGGICNYYTTINVKSCIIALNNAQFGPDGFGAFVSQGYNVVSKADGTTGFTQPTDQTGTIASPLEPHLDPAGLQNNGGPTLTIALLANSPAIDHGAPDSLPQDQRGYGRVGVPDVGAFELGGGAPHPPFFTGEVSLGNGVYYLQFPNGTPFGYYAYLTDPHRVYHVDMGYEYWVDANDGHSGIYFYDFMSTHIFYTNPSVFSFLYDFNLNAVLFYFPDPNNPGRYTTNPRYFYNFATGQIITL